MAALASSVVCKSEFLGSSIAVNAAAPKAAAQGSQVVRAATVPSKTIKKAIPQLRKAVPQVKRVLPQVKRAVPQVKKVTAAPQVKKTVQQLKKAAPQVKKQIKRTVAPALKTGGELSKWYGPDRRIFLPEGLLDKSEIPSYLTGEVPGDYGYDPLGLGKKPKDFEKYQAAELIHARWAMLGAAGFVLPEAFNKFGAVCGPEAVWFKTGALLLEGESLQYFGLTVPVNLAFATFFEILLVGGAEYYRQTNKSPLGSDLDELHPGGAFDPLGLASDPDTFALLKVKEIKNGRLAMFAMLGFFIQAYVTGEGPVENLTAHLSDPFGNNLLTVLQGDIERLPSL